MPAQMLDRRLARLERALKGDERQRLIALFIVPADCEDRGAFAERCRVKAGAQARRPLLIKFIDTNLVSRRVLVPSPMWNMRSSMPSSVSV